MSRENLLRALVALDPSTSIDAALDAVASLLGGRRALLEGLLVEDVNLLHLSELPFIRVLDRTTGSERAFDRDRLERQLKSRAERSRRAFEEAAKRLRMRSSFRVERGDLRSELGRAARGADLLVISHSRTRRFEIPDRATSRIVSWAEARTVVVVRESWRGGRTVAVVAGDVVRDRIALTIAAGLAHSEGLPLTVLLSGTPKEELEARLEELAGEWSVPIERERLELDDAETLVECVQRRRALALVLAATAPALDEESLHRLLDELPCALIVAR